jgi:hypothetical protein
MHQLLHNRSFHPKHTCRVLKSQFIRFKRICSSFREYYLACFTLYKVLREREAIHSLFLEDFDVKSGYPMLIYNLRSKQSSSLDKVLPLVNLYNPVSSNIMYKTKRIVAKLNIVQK